MGIGVKTKPKQLDISTLSKLNTIVSDATLVDGTMIKAYPAPFLSNLIPDSNLPSTTGNFVIKGSFFTKTMTVVIEGQIVNYITFINSHEVHVNVTSGASEGKFNVTLNNGTEAIFTNALLIILGTVFSPKAADFTNKTAEIIAIDAGLELALDETTSTAKWGQEIDSTKSFEIRYKTSISPLSDEHTNGFNVYLKKVSDNSIFVWHRMVAYDYTYFPLSSANKENYQTERNYKFRYVAGTLKLYVNDVLLRDWGAFTMVNCFLEFSLYRQDIKDIKYIELAV